MTNHKLNECEYKGGCREAASFKAVPVSKTHIFETLGPPNWAERGQPKARHLRAARADKAEQEVERLNLAMSNKDNVMSRLPQG